jgi:hypothetical protein
MLKRTHTRAAMAAFLILAASLAALRLALAAPPADAGRADPSPATRPARGVRIGTYDSRAVALAWTRSDSASIKAWNQHRDELMRKAKAAKDAGKQDGKDIVEVMNIQFLQHAWAFSTVPPESALAELRPRLVEIAREAGVVLIVPRTDWQDPAVQTVDLTDKLVAEFKPTPQVRKMLTGFEKKPPITLEELTRLRDF